MAISVEERKRKVDDLRKDHEDYFQTMGIINAEFIPKMAHRPSGKDDLHLGFFPSELEKEVDIYTEFVSIDYASEDPKRTLYLLRHNPHWKEEFELIESNKGYKRHMVAVNELKVINDILTRSNEKEAPKGGVINTKSINENPLTLFDLPNPDQISDTSLLVVKLEEINQTLITLTKVINKFNK